MVITKTRSSKFKELIKTVPIVYAPLKRVHSHFSHERHRLQQLACIGRSKDTLILNTMPRAGSHYLQMLLANYWNVEYLGAKERIGFKDIKRDIWNSEFNNSLEDFTEKKKSLHEKLGVADVIFEHFNPFLPFYSCKKIIYLYRNPLDNIISRYFCFHVNRERPRQKLSHVAEAIGVHLPAFMQHYKQIKKMSGKKNVHTVSYEEVLNQPAETLVRILTFLEQRVNENSVQKAVEFSAKDHVVNDEKKYNGSKDIIGNSQKSSFIRNPEVGQWKTTFTSAEVKQVERLLNVEGIKLDEFVLE